MNSIKPVYQKKPYYFFCTFLNSPHYQYNFFARLFQKKTPPSSLIYMISSSEFIPFLFFSCSSFQRDFEAQKHKLISNSILRWNWVEVIIQKNRKTDLKFKLQSSFLYLLRVKSTPKSHKKISLMCAARRPWLTNAYMFLKINNNRNLIKT